MIRLATSALLLPLLLAPNARAEKAPEEFEFFQSEAKTVTASRRPESAAAAPSTVYVVTSEEIRVSGAQTLWDALRAVPGVDVMNDRTSHADVSIRGMNKVFNNRVLVLLDGKTVLNGFYDYTNWETIPVTLEEVDRIEVVEGPASALYGSNAVNGVINIITKTPDQLRGGALAFAGGERDTYAGQAVAGGRRGDQFFKAGAGWRSTNRFSDASKEASAVAKFHALYGVDLFDDARWTVSGGVSDHDVNVSNGPSNDVGKTGFVRSDFAVGQTSARFFWNGGRGEYRDYPNFPFHLSYDTYDASLERRFDLPRDNALTAGAGYRRDTAASDVFAPGRRDQTLWSLYAEDSWAAAERWTFVGSLRGDHHPFTRWQVSPRVSAIYEPNGVHSYRVTAASAFRNPTLLENYVDFSGSIPSTVPGFTTMNFLVLPNSELEPENVRFLEAAYRGTFGRVKAGVTGFFYRQTNLVRQQNAVAAAGPALDTTVSFVNDGETKALGGEVSVEFQAASWLRSYANYSYQSLIDRVPAQTTARSAPRHKVNLGVRAKRPLWTASVGADWVAATRWSDGSVGVEPVYAQVPAYLVLNVAAARRLTGRLDGFELGVSGFNIADRHHELLPRQSVSAPGQYGGPIDQRWCGTVAYRFGGAR